MSEKVKIVFPTDFSDVINNAVQSARFLAKTHDAELVLLHVIEKPTSPLKIFSGFDEDEARKQAMKELSALEEAIGDPDLKVDKMVVIGKPAYKMIVETAKDIDADFIVMATHGLDGFKEYFVGSNASMVIRTAPCPVISIKGAPNSPNFGKILLPLDLTQETGEKVGMGIKMAEKFGSKLFVLTVLWSDDEGIHRRLKKRMAKAVKHIQAHNVEVDSTMVVTQNPNIADTVMDYGKQIDADLLVIMTQQEHSIKEQFLGSNAARIVNHSDVPVLSMKPTREYRSRRFSDSHFG